MPGFKVRSDVRGGAAGSRLLDRGEPGSERDPDFVPPADLVIADVHGAIRGS